MRISVTFRHMDHNDALKEYATEKLGKIKKYLYSPGEASVVLSVEKHRNIAEITISADKTTLMGKEVTDDMYSAIDMVINKIEKQARRHKEKLTDHNKESVRIPQELA
jgi:putative sigma-54 modulation protein